jgi:hypothetical protein
LPARRPRSRSSVAIPAGPRTPIQDVSHRPCRPADLDPGRQGPSLPARRP